MRSQHNWVILFVITGNIEGILHFTGWMMQWKIEQLEIILIGLDVAAAVDQVVAVARAGGV